MTRVQEKIKKWIYFSLFSQLNPLYAALTTTHTRATELPVGKLLHLKMSLAEVKYTKPA